jgi:hypothetical protein
MVSHGFDIVSNGLLNEPFLGSVALTAHDILLVDHSESAGLQGPAMPAMLDRWKQPVLFNDTTATGISLQQGNPQFGRDLAGRLLDLVKTTGVT